TGFVEDQSVSLPGLSTPEAVWADIDQDGDQDFVLVGSDGGTPFTGVYLNNGFRGGFTLYTESALMTLSGSSVAWGDLDNDGFQDLAISGTSGPQPQVFIYRFDNNNQSFTLHSTLLGVQNGSIQWGDLDDDGLTDLTMVGLDGNDQPLAFVYLNNNGTSFTEDVVSSQALLGGTEAQMAWGDFDKDGKLDLATISADSTARRSLSLYQNIDLNPNQSPQAPSPIGFVIDADSVVLSWNDPNDGLTYQYSVYEIGADTFSVVPDADTLSGLRRLTAQGNAGSNQRIRLEDLPEGTYTWKVQAIDADYEGSSFAQGDTFTFNPPHFVQSNQILFDEAVQGVSDAQTEWIDYDKDGDLDLFIAGSQGGSPAIFLYQNQLGLKLSLDLQNQAVFTALENAYFAWGDVDLDGSLDLLLGGGTPGNPQLRLYLNESGTFIESTIAVPALSDGQAAFCDVDGEGSLDVIMIGLNDAQIPTTQIYLNQKDNTFKVLNLGGNIPGTRNGSLQVMDLNLDGKNDLVIGGENSQGQTFLSAFLNNPLNGFFPAIDLLPSNWNSVAQPIIEVGDLNNDRYPDIIATASNPAGTLSWISLENQLGSGGNFALLDLGLDGVEGLTEGQAQVGDYDDDGFTDLAITGQGSSQAVTRIYSRKGTDQQFVEDTRASSELISLGTGSHLAWGDYNQDGKIDLAQVGEEALYIYRNDEPSPNNTPSAPQNLNIEIIGADVRLEWESVSDSYSYNVFLVGENDTTFILSPASDTLSGLREIIAQGNGHFANSLTIENLPTKQEGENYLWGVQSIDKDYEGSSFTKGAFAFTPPAFQDISETAFNGSVPDALTEGELVLVDINTDGNLDILTAGIQNGSRVTKVYLNQSGTFIEDPSNDGLTGVSSAMVAVGDWDGDNDPDVFISGITDGNGNLEATLYRNDQGRLVADANASGNLIAVARGDAAWTDFDRDGDEDLMVIGVSQGIKSSTLYRNDGENGLTPLTDIVVGQEGFIALSDGAIAWGDFDLNLGSFDTLDNRPDLVMAGLDENQNPATVIYQNLGNGQFREFARTSLPQLGLSYVNFTDLNNDRFPDLILTGELPDLSLQTAIYPFDPANQEFDVNDPFTTAMIPGVANGIAITGDYDDDGLSDLLISGEISGAQEVATFKNIHDETPQTFLKDLLSSGDLDSLNIRQPVWGDINNDKKLDIVSLGGTSFGNTEESLIVLGNIDLTPNLDELVPENLSLFVDGAKVILSWSDLGTRFTYNLSLTNRTTGQVIVSPLADLNSGKRFVAAEGNMGHNTSILFDTLTTGTYVVRVQTVDADLEGSLFSDSLVFDYTRPVPRWQVNNIATYYPDNGTAESSIVVLNDSVVSSVLVWHRPIANADSAYQSVLAQRSGNTYSFDISQARGDELGVSYYFQLVGKFGFNTLTDTFHTYRTYTEGITYEITRAGRSALDYNIISFPIELTNPRAESFMPEGLGRYSRYRWRMFQWSNSLAVNGELAGAVVQVTPNEGYWLILKDPGGFQTGAGNAVQANVLEPYELEIKEGWNQIGNPYNFRLYWDRVEAANPGTIDNIDGLVNFSGGFTDAEPFIEAQRGAFVRSDSNFTLLLPVGKGPKNRLANPEKNQLIGSL
ncbi:MAG: VCBS repeat-containing protein, partial [Bacteroidota bacterium]